MIVGEKIKERRKELGLSTRELADRMGYANHSTIVRIESGKHDINQSRISEFARVLGTTPAHLMGWDVSAEEAGATAAKVLKNPRIFRFMTNYLSLSEADQLMVDGLVSSLASKQKED